MRRSVTRYGEHFYGASLLFGFLACARTFFNAPSLNLLVYIMSSVYLWGKKIRAYFFFFLHISDRCEILVITGASLCELQCFFYKDFSASMH